MCKCTNFPLFAIYDTNYLTKPRSLSNQDLFCTYSSEYLNETKLTTFDQFKYIYYRFRTLTFANYPFIPTKAFRYIQFESQSVKQTHKTNNRNVIAFVNIEQTHSSIFEELNLSDSQEQLIISFYNSPSLVYVKELILENYYAHGGFKSFNNRELSQCFPNLKYLKIFSRSIQHITKRMFEHLNQLEYLILNGITTIENEAFFNLYHLKELNLGKDIYRLDPYAFLHMTTTLLILNESINFQLDDNKHFCVFAQFSPLTNLKTFIKFPKDLNTCSCIIRYLYRHIDKSLMSLTPYCYSNSSLYVLAQEERLCYFEQRLLQCHVLPDEGITIYGKHYNVSYFYQQQTSKHRNQLTIFYHYRIYIIIILIFILIISISFTLFCIRQQKQRNNSTYRHLNRLLKRSRLRENDNVTMDIIYHHTNDHPDVISSTIPISTKV
ncbi:unnamed protein product [Adineta steineri]|uniref:Uncharacterized protein n=1 Tax=Adineta steineri TaxID=433720 RepID=A0A813TBM7_9BILA|nr:unnamed protein product [Adineta steineri]